MKKSRFSEEQILAILKQREAGVKTADLCRDHGVSAATFYQWKAKYVGMDVSEAQRLSRENQESAMDFIVEGLLNRPITSGDG